MRTSVISAAVLTVAVAGLLHAQDDGAGHEPPYFEGELAYSQAMAFDYDQDGTPNQVQFWIRFEGRPAVGEAGEAGSRQESGSLSYLVADLERREKVDNWLMGFNMGFPMAEKPYPISNIVVNGKTVSFDLQGATWTVTDAGDDWQEDEIEIRDHRGPRPGRFYGGDVRVVPDPLTTTEPVAIAENRECNECHEDAAVTMAAGGGPHRELGCADCHTEHPPDVEGVVFPACLECHDSHSEAMAASSCVECHAGHDFTRVAHAATMPDAYCAPCHGEVVDTLRASRSLHMGVKCVLCHQSEHSAEAKPCQHCHRGTHPQHVMQSPDRCRDCHATAHDIDRGRAE
jgi:hypothetical protein